MAIATSPYGSAEPPPSGFRYLNGTENYLPPFTVVEDSMRVSILVHGAQRTERVIPVIVLTPRA